VENNNKKTGTKKSKWHIKTEVAISGSKVEEQIQSTRKARKTKRWGGLVESSTKTQDTTKDPTSPLGENIPSPFGKWE